MSGFQTIDGTCRPENSTVEIAGTITDASGTPIPAASLTSVKVWLFHKATKAIVNLRDAQDVKNANGGTVDPTSGAFVLALGPLDTVLESQSLATSDIVAEFEWVYNAGASTGRASVQFTVGNLVKIP